MYVIDKEMHFRFYLLDLVQEGAHPGVDDLDELLQDVVLDGHEMMLCPEGVQVPAGSVLPAGSCQQADDRVIVQVVHAGRIPAPISHAHDRLGVEPASTADEHDGISSVSYQRRHGWPAC